MKKLLKNEICGFVNSARDSYVVENWLKSQTFRLKKKRGEMQTCVWEARFALLSTFTFLLFFLFFSSRKVWLFNQFSATYGSRTLFTNPQISFFNNFFIKNGSHGTIYTFKNYFVTVFFNFSVFSCIQTDPYSSDFPLSIFFPIFGIKLFGELSEKTPNPHPSFSPLLL